LPATSGPAGECPASGEPVFVRSYPYRGACALFPAHYCSPEQRNKSSDRRDSENRTHGKACKQVHPVKIYLFRGDDEADQGEGGGPERYLCRGRVIRYLVAKLGQNPRLNSGGGDDEFVDCGWCDGDGLVQVSPDFR